MAYGNPAAPSEALKLHESGFSGQAHITPWQNALSFASLEAIPVNNPGLLHPAAAPVHRGLTASVTPSPAGMFRPYSRQERVSLLRNTQSAGSFSARGLLPYLLFMGGSILLVRNSKTRGFVAGAWILVAGWWLAICCLQPWIAENIRYFVLLNPVLAIMAIPCFDFGSRWWHKALAFGALLTALSNQHTIVADGFKVGMNNVLFRDHYLAWQDILQQREMVLARASDQTIPVLILHDPYINTTGYFRTGRKAKVMLLPTNVTFPKPVLEALVENDALLVIHRLNREP